MLGSLTICAQAHPSLILYYNCEYLLFGNTYAAIVHNMLKYMLRARGGRAKLLTNQQTESE